MDGSQQSCMCSRNNLCVRIYSPFYSVPRNGMHAFNAAFAYFQAWLNAFRYAVGG